MTKMRVYPLMRQSLYSGIPVMLFLLLLCLKRNYEFKINIKTCIEHVTSPPPYGRRVPGPRSPADDLWKPACTE